MREGLAFTGLMAAVVTMAAVVNAVPAAFTEKDTVPNPPASNISVPSNPAPVSQIQLPLPQPNTGAPNPPAVTRTDPNTSPQQPTAPRPSVPVQQPVQPTQAPQPQPSPQPTQQPGNPCGIGLVLDPVLGVCVRL